MILKASERGDAPQLARYLLALRDNDHVELHELSGFVAEDLRGAFAELEAIARGTRCKNHLFSMSFNPSQQAQVTIDEFEKAVAKVERKLGLTGQPRVIVFHEKDGRRHAHVVWSRIDAGRKRALNMEHYKLRLRDVSRELFREHGWEMPRGLRDWRERDPLNFARAEWQQARRADLDPKQLKALFHHCWNRSDSGAAFVAALKERGFVVARGDRRGFVAVDYQGEVYARLIGVRTKEVAAKLGDPANLPSIDQVKAEYAARMTGRLKTFIRDVELDAGRTRQSFEFRRAEMVGRHREERARLQEAQKRRSIAETKERAARLPRGFSGIWHRLTGQYGRIREMNEREAWESFQRDRGQRDDLIAVQLDERRGLQQDFRQERGRQQRELLQLREDIARYQERGPERREPEREREPEHEERRRPRRRGRERRMTRD